VPQLIVPDNARALIADPDRYEPRASAFAELDRPALAALAPSRYEFAYFRTAKVHIDYHVQLEGHFYSVPHALVGRAVQVRVTAAGVECLHGGHRVAVHARSSRIGDFTTIAEHLPAAHRAHREWTPSRLIDWGRRIGVSTAEVVHLLRPLRELDERLRGMGPRIRHQPAGPA